MDAYGFGPSAVFPVMILFVGQHPTIEGAQTWVRGPCLLQTAAPYGLVCSKLFWVCLTICSLLVKRC